MKFVITAVVYGKENLFATRMMPLEEWENPETVKRQGEMEIYQYETDMGSFEDAGSAEARVRSIELSSVLEIVANPLSEKPYFVGESKSPTKWLFPIRLYLDDERDTPDGYIRCYTVDQVLRYIRGFEAAGLRIGLLSLDNDLGDDPVTGERLAEGHTVLKWILEQLSAGKGQFISPRELVVHTRNPIAADRMRSDWRQIMRWGSGGWT